MRGIQFILIAAVILSSALFVSSLSSQRTRAWKRVLLVLFILFAVVAVSWPELTSQVAHAVGVGRGADLLLYGVVVAFLAFALNVYVKFQQQRDKLYDLARQQALMEATLRHEEILHP